MNFAAAEIELVAGNARQAARWRTNFRRKIRQRRDVVADDGGRRGELRSGNLHAVAGVSGKADGDGFDFFRWQVS